MKNNLILHGHFYQPPREDPWTGLVPMQESADPFHDWNKRITKECYGANAFSRYLDYDGRINDITNNYEYLSFDFGPTLMSWLKGNAPNVYRRILDADKISIERNGGHGNAIAQGYNHTILPLDTPKDAELQIEWGLKDFKSHFKRKSEGIWLPEAAVNYKIIDILISRGIKFIILSPWQADAIQSESSESWQLLDDQPAPSWRPYCIAGEKGSIAVFFYNNILAQGISFGHYLQDAEKLYTRLTRLYSSQESSYLIHTATDGEIYGHHEPFGDMGLSALIKKINNDDKFTLTNYGFYLEQHPPVYNARLKLGEANKGSSWSCFHGVSRWYKDCGCTTGGEEGWNQKWRTPLRRAYEILSKKLNLIYKQEIEKLSKKDPDTILKDYINILTGKESHDHFSERILKNTRNNDGDRIKLFQLLEGQKFRVYSFTSCGWFFSEISGIEPVQNMKYAFKAIDLYRQFSEEDFTKDFLAELEKAQSNIILKVNGNTQNRTSGKDIFISLKPKHSAELEAATNFLIQELSNQTGITGTYGIYTLLNAERRIQTNNTHKTIKIDLNNSTTGNRCSYLFAVPDESSKDLTISVSTNNSPLKENLNSSLKTFPEDLRREISDFFISSMEKFYNLLSPEEFSGLKKAFKYAETLRVRVPKSIMKTAEIVITRQLEHILCDSKTNLSGKDLNTIEDLLSFASRFKIKISRDEIVSRLSLYLSVQFDKPQTLINDISIQYIFRLYEIARSGGIEPEVTIPQNIIFHHIEVWRAILKDPGYIPNRNSITVLSQLVAMGKILSINVDDLAKSLVEKEEEKQY